MNLTFQTGAKAVLESNDESVGDLAKHLGKGLLMGARGNSGVISSQLFRGFAKAWRIRKSDGSGPSRCVCTWRRDGL